MGNCDSKKNQSIPKPVNQDPLSKYIDDAELKAYEENKINKFYKREENKASQNFDYYIKCFFSNKKFNYLNIVKNNLIAKNANSICYNKIVDEINLIKQKENLFPIKYFTVLLLGKAGVGKSTLINGLTKLRKEAPNAKGYPVTMQYYIYQTKFTNFIKFIDSKGIELEGHRAIGNLKNEYSKIIRKQLNSKDNNDYIRCIWYCITGNKLEHAEIELIELLINSMQKEFKIQFIIVYLQANIAELYELETCVHENFPSQKFIKVIAKDMPIVGGAIAKEFGLDFLLKETINICIDSLKNNESHLRNNIATKMTNYIIDQLDDKNSKNTQNIIEETKCILYDGLKNNDNFQKYISDIFSKNDQKFLGTKNFQYNQHNKHNINNSLQEKAMNFQNNQTNNFIQEETKNYLYNCQKYIDSLIEPVLDDFSKEFMNYQIQIMKNSKKLIQPENLRQFEDFRNSTKLSLNNNFNSLGQRHYIDYIKLNICPSLSNQYEKNIRDINNEIVYNSDIQELINQAFITKLYDFASRTTKIIQNLNFRTIERYDNLYEGQKIEIDENNIKI